LVVGNYNIHCISLLFSVAISPGLYFLQGNSYMGQHVTMVFG